MKCFQFALSPTSHHQTFCLQVPEPVEESVTPMRERLGLEATQKGQAALMIRDTVRADHGVFTVQVENQHGAATATCVVNILGNKEPIHVILPQHRTL